MPAGAGTSAAADGQRQGDGRAPPRQTRDTGEIWEDTFPLRRKDGAYRWFLSRAVPIRDAVGNVVRWFGTNTDVTELRDAEERQKLLINELNHRVKWAPVGNPSGGGF
jgi:hypothetical protein